MRTSSRLKRSSVPAKRRFAALGTLRDHREARGRGREEMCDAVGFAEIDGTQHERLGL